MEKKLHFLSILDHFQKIKKNVKYSDFEPLSSRGGKTFLCMSSLIRPFASGVISYCICTHLCKVLRHNNHVEGSERGKGVGRRWWCVGGYWFLIWFDHSIHIGVIVLDWIISGYQRYGKWSRRDNKKEHKFVPESVFYGFKGLGSSQLFAISPDHGRIA